MMPFKDLYARPCRLPLYWNKVGENEILGLVLTLKTHNVIEVVRARSKWLKFVRLDMLIRDIDH